MRSHGIDNMPYMAYVSAWSLTMVVGYATLGSGGSRIVTRPLFLSARVGSGHETKAFPVFRTLPLPCIILNKNQRTKNGGGLGMKLVIAAVLSLIVSFRKTKFTGSGTELLY